MAKKKTDKSESTEPKHARAAKKAPAKSKVAETKVSSAKGAGAKPAKPQAPTGSPVIDTSLAAAAAARMLFSKRPNQSDEERTEGSSLIKQIKSDLNKPHSATLSGVLDKNAPAGTKKPSNLPFGQKQVGHNQTFGPDVTRTGVPRRTSG